MADPLAAFKRRDGRHRCPDLFQDAGVLGGEVVIGRYKDDVFAALINLAEQRLVLVFEQFRLTRRLRGAAAMLEQRG